MNSAAEGHQHLENVVLHVRFKPSDLAFRSRGTAKTINSAAAAERRQNPEILQIASENKQNRHIVCKTPESL